MSRDISTINLAEVNASHLYEIILVKLEFDTPAYIHSGIGTITYDSNDYVGVGDFGSIGDAKELEDASPHSLTLTLSAIDASLAAEALDSGNYGDVVTIYIGYRQDDGTLVDDPWVLWRGTYENASITHGENSSISVTVRHDLAILEEKDGSRFTDEDQQQNFAGDEGFEFVYAMGNMKLVWGKGPVTGSFDGGDDATQPRYVQE